MNKLFTLKVIFSLLLFTTFSYKTNAQSDVQTDSVKRVIVVVRPGYTDRSTYKSIVTTPNNNLNNINLSSDSAAYNKIDSYSSTSGSTSSAAQTTSDSNSDEPALAPTTSERSGSADYMKPVKKMHKAIHVNLVPQYAAPVQRRVSHASQHAKPVSQTTINNTSITNNYYNTPKVTDTTLTKPAIKHDTVFITKTDTVLNTPPKHTSNKILFLELGGPGLAISINYDQRFSDRKDGLGFRVGTGYFGDGGNTVFTIPLQINYLLGSNGKYLEFGGGTTFLNTTGDNTGKTFIFDRVTGFIGTATIGVRYEPEKSLNFRLAFVPIFAGPGEEIIYVGGFSVGYTF